MSSSILAHTQNHLQRAALVLLFLYFLIASRYYFLTVEKRTQIELFCISGLFLRNFLESACGTGYCSRKDFRHLYFLPSYSFGGLLLAIHSFRQNSFAYFFHFPLIVENSSLKNLSLIGNFTMLSIYTAYTA